MARDIVSVKLDIIFKKLFAQKGSEDILRALLASLLEIPKASIEKVEVTNPELIPDEEDGKFSFLDINVLVDDKLVNVEMQICADDDYRDRTLFYWSKLYTGELKRGEEYKELKKCISINIVNFIFSDNPSYHSKYQLREQNTGDLLTDKCAIHFFELKKINKNINKNGSEMELWLQLINAESEEELTMLNETNIPEIKKAVTIIHEMTADERTREMARLREKALHDKASALGSAKRNGIAEGIAEGIAKERAEFSEQVTKRLRNLGMSDEDIKTVIDRSSD